LPGRGEAFLLLELNVVNEEETMVVPLIQLPR